VPRTETRREKSFRPFLRDGKKRTEPGRVAEGVRKGKVRPLHVVQVGGSPYRSISSGPSTDSVWASTRHKGLITHKFADLRRSRNVNMKYENEDGGNKSDVRGSVGSFMKASIIVLDGLLCLVAAVESHFALLPLASLPPVSPRFLFRDSLYLAFPLYFFLSLVYSTRLSPSLPCFLIGDVDGNIRTIRTRIWFSHGEKALCLAFCSCRFDSRQLVILLFFLAEVGNNRGRDGFIDMKIVTTVSN